VKLGKRKYYLQNFALPEAVVILIFLEGRIFSVRLKDMAT
jgi:hypothetical protein